jgi:DNA-binding MarR family transcriptional regulator
VEVDTIARHLHLSGAFATIETGKLAELGYVEKLANPEDRRRVMTPVTHSGHVIFVARVANIKVDGEAQPLISFRGTFGKSAVEIQTPEA